ncbi:cysteine synthase A [archaeon]|nr:cysteine synthase A [archaeon]
MMVGNTPLVEVDGIFAKLECVNPTGSIKDRIAKYIIEESEKKGLLSSGMKIVEATSGNTGIGLSYFSKLKGYDLTIVMPENMTEERKRIMRELGANLILCSKEGSFAEAAKIRDKIAEKEGYFNPDQFSNPLNVECHEKTTGVEILSGLEKYSDKPIDCFVAGVGTGGTLIGVGKALKKKFPNVLIVAVEPSESQVMAGGSGGEHFIQGIGDGFIPAIAGNGNGGLNPLIGRVECVSSEEALGAAKEIQEKHGFCVGVSSGANFLVAKKLQKEFQTIVTVFPDGYKKYESFGLTHSCGRCSCECKRLNVLSENCNN